jgi:WD40 repeat protein
VAVLPLGTTGRPDKAAVPRIDGHSSLVTDFAFSPHDDGLLATGSQDQTVKVWRVPRAGLQGSLTTPEAALPELGRRVETVAWHPAAEALLAVSSGREVGLWDLTRGARAWSHAGHGGQLQSTAWQAAGGLLATQAKDRLLRVLDPRAEGSAMEAASHEGIKDSKVGRAGHL